MNNLIIISIVLIIIIIWFICPAKINQTELDSKILNGWWIGNSSFLEQSGLKYLFMNLATSPDGKNLDTVGYLIAGDNEGILYNSPINMKLEYKDQKDCSVITYNVNLASEEKLPFSKDSNLVLDRTNATISVYKDNVLYLYCSK